MSLKKIVFWSHLCVGVAAGVVVFVLSATGVLLTYEEQIKDLAISGYSLENTDAARLSIDDLAVRAMAETDGRVTALVLENDPSAPVAATMGRDGTAYLDPTTGEMLGTESERVAAFFDTVTGLHRWFALEGTGRDMARAITGAANLGFLFLLISGIYLWWPKSWKWRILRNNVLFRRNLPNSKARDYNWHHVFGIWAVVPLFFVIVSGAVISYPWASNLVYAVYGEEPAAGSGRQRGGPAPTGGLELTEGGVGLQALVEQAEIYDPEWNTLSLTLPRAAGNGPVAIKVDSGNGFQTAAQTTLMFNEASGALMSTRGVETMTPGQQARAWMRFIHTGQVYGIVGQTLAGLGSLAALFMVWTGLALAWRRLIRPLFTARAHS